MALPRRALVPAVLGALAPAPARSGLPTPDRHGADAQVTVRIVAYGYRTGTALARFHPDPPMTER